MPSAQSLGLPPPYYAKPGPCAMVIISGHNLLVEGHGNVVFPDGAPRPYNSSLVRRGYIVDYRGQGYYVFVTRKSHNGGWAYTHHDPSAPPATAMTINVNSNGQANQNGSGPHLSGATAIIQTITGSITPPISPSLSPMPSTSSNDQAESEYDADLESEYTVDEDLSELIHQVNQFVETSMDIENLLDAGDSEGLVYEMEATSPEETDISDESEMSVSPSPEPDTARAEDTSTTPRQRGVQESPTSAALPALYERSNFRSTFSGWPTYEQAAHYGLNPGYATASNWGVSNGNGLRSILPGIRAFESSRTFTTGTGEPAISTAIQQALHHPHIVQPKPLRAQIWKSGTIRSLDLFANNNYGPRYEHEILESNHGSETTMEEFRVPFNRRTETIL